MTPHVAGFSAAECGLAACLLDHLSNHQIAAAMGSWHTTTVRRIRAMKQRFHVTTRTALVVELARIEWEAA